MSKQTTPAAIGALKDLVRTTGRKRPNLHIWHGVEGIGKTSLAAQMPGCVFLPTLREMGIETLIDNGRIPETPFLPPAQTWDEARGYIKELRTQDHGYKALVVDTVNGLEALCHEYVCHRDFNGDWGEKGFSAYGRGVKVSIPEWKDMMCDLEALRTERGMTVVLLAHTAVKAFRNPTGADYDRYTVRLAPETWGVTHEEADLVLFMNWEVFVEGANDHRRGKGTGKARIMYTERDAAWDAKNRHGLPPEIDLGTTVDGAWANFKTAFKQGAANGAN